MSGIETVGVAGAGGTMGIGIAIVMARAGFATLAFDRSAAALERAIGQATVFLAKSVERGKLTREAADAIGGRITPVTDVAALKDCDLVIEAVFEDLETKKSLFAAIDGLCSPHAILASNTSTLSITEIAAASRRPERVVGLHFCLPAQLMRLVEVSPGLMTSEETFARAWAFMERCGQIPVKTQDKPGFILNALLVPFNNDAIRAVEAGVAQPAAIDRAVKAGLGYKMGPLELVDLVGLDTQLRLCEAFYPITLDPRASAPPLLRRMVAAGLLGRKSGRGFFDYAGETIYGG
ncbi:MAG: 3-hydroxyacyl-CoA dehydrogenase family protein [Alphaproteobacteria bacterium]|nr:3-hydroxyacyl-CoA dehydrogenase family protein [Alphaproteobacteria bacterium]